MRTVESLLERAQAAPAEADARLLTLSYGDQAAYATMKTLVAQYPQLQVASARSALISRISAIADGARAAVDEARRRLLGDEADAEAARLLGEVSLCPRLDAETFDQIIAQIGRVWDRAAARAPDAVPSDADALAADIHDVSAYGGMLLNVIGQTMEELEKLRPDRWENLRKRATSAVHAGLERTRAVAERFPMAAAELRLAGEMARSLSISSSYDLLHTGVAALGPLAFPWRAAPARGPDPRGPAPRGRAPRGHAH